MEKFKKIYLLIFIISSLSLYLLIFITKRFNFLEAIYEPKISLGINLFITISLAIYLIIDFDKNHKIISLFSAVLFLYIGFNYLKSSIDILNTNYTDEFNRMGWDISKANRNMTYLNIVFLIKTLLIKCSDYIKLAYEEYNEKMSIKKEN